MGWSHVSVEKSTTGYDCYLNPTSNELRNFKACGMHLSNIALLVIEVDVPIVVTLPIVLVSIVVQSKVQNNTIAYNSMAYCE